MAPRRQEDPQVTDLSRYRRERAKAAKTAKASKPSSGTGDEPFLGRRPKAGLFIVLVIAVLAALGWLQAHH